MSTEIKWTIVMVTPGEEELALLAELTARRDARIIGLVDPDGQSVGAGLAEIMGLPVYPDLASVPEGRARFLVHPPLDDAVEVIIDDAVAYGMTPVSVKNFANLLVDHALTTTPHSRPASSRMNFDFLETETSAIHETLGRIEEALDREALLRWLLKLASKATRASSGSIMLFDEATQELYVAFAHGLSQNTLHRTRVRLGEGISGRVAASGEAEIIRGNLNQRSPRDRSNLQSAICAPINWQGQLVGVLNISAAAGDQDLKPDAMAIVENLTQRFGMILNRFLRLQTIRDGEIFRKMEEQLTESSVFADPVNRTLCDWADNLTGITGADNLSLSILTADGDLLVAEAEGSHYESPASPEKDAVLASGSPLVLRPASADPDLPEGDCTIFHLPVGRGPTRALLTVVFHTASRSHHFHSLSAEVIYLVNRHLATYLDKAATNDQLDRLTTLASTLTELSTIEPGDVKTLSHKAVSAACRLTGAQQACILKDENDSFDSRNGSFGPELKSEAIRLLQETGSRGWNSTILNSDKAPGDPSTAQSLLVVPLRSDQPFPGLILINKKRLHPLDGSSFTEFDALFARRLLPVFHARSTLSVSAVVKEVPLPEVPTPVSPQPEPVITEPVMDIQRALSIEIDRCKRYHTMVGVVAFRVTPSTGVVPDVDHLVEKLSATLRTSDQAGCLPDGTILILVPEDIQSLPMLQKRVTGLLKITAGQEDLLVQTSSRVFPGTGKNAQELIDSVLGGID
jgi:GAF domain-containing protein